MTRAEWDAWMPRQLAGYARHIADSGEMSEADAWAKARPDTARSFLGGYTTGGRLALAVRAGYRSRPADGVGLQHRGGPVLSWPRLRAGGDDPGRGRGPVPRHDLARAQRARAEYDRAVALRQPRLRRHGDADEEAPVARARPAEGTAETASRVVSPGRLLIEHEFDRRIGLRHS